MITPVDSSIAAKALGNSYARRPEKNAGVAENIADPVTLSDEARQRLLADESASDTPSSAYRVTGPVRRFSEMLKENGGNLVAIKMSDEQIAESELHEQQLKAREQVNFNYAKSHQYQPVGQVFVKGELVATVLDSGGYETSANLGLSEAMLSPHERLAEIARAVNGEISYADFVPLDSWSGPSAPESMLPPLTARSLMEIFQQEIAPLFEKQRQGQV